jgi:hypothetical protein
MGGGIIIQQRAAIKTAVNDPSISGVLPQSCRDRVMDINAKGLADWSADETTFMAAMLTVAVHC